MKKNTQELAVRRDPAAESVSLAEVDRMLRLEWWLNHGHRGLYGDDGEMQCSMCPADFKRQPLSELEPLVCAARAVSMPVTPPAGATIVSITPHERGGPFPTLPNGFHPDTARIIQRARGLLADGIDYVVVGNYVATYITLIPLPKQDVGAIFAYLMKAVDGVARRALLADQRLAARTPLHS